MRAFAAAALLLGLAACTAPRTAELLVAGDGLPARAELAEVPFYPQEKYQCGPAALAMAATWAGQPVTPDELVPQVYTPSREGTLRSDMLAAARRQGRLATPVDGLRNLLTEIAAGHPVVVFQNLGFDWYPQWHYAVAIGYDLDQREIVLHSGLTARQRLDLSTFERTWERGSNWALVVLPPDRLPATARAATVLTAAIGLERADRLAEAAEAYRAIAKRWPDSFTARMGLGNTLFGQDDFAGAVSAFQDAIAQRPTSAAAWNNLAYALAKQGQYARARQAAEQAARLSPVRAGGVREGVQEASDKTL